MRICGIEKVSLVDFKDKVGCTIFLGGCNYKCPFCHNSQLALNKEKEAISFDELVSYLKKREGIIEAICVSGGEPTLTPDLKEKLLVLKKLGLFVKLDTNGSNFDVLKELLDEKIVDYVAMDIKNSFTNYFVSCGKEVDLNEVKKSISYLINNDYDYEFRITLVDEFNKKSDIEEIAHMLKGSKLLYLQKYIPQESCFNNKLNHIDKETVLEYKDYLLKFIREVYLRNY